MSDPGKLDPYAQAKADVAGQQTAPPPATTGYQDELEIPTDVQRHWRRIQTEIHRRTPGWRRRREVLSKDPVELGRFLERFIALRDERMTFRDQLLRREFLFVFEPPERPLQRSPNPRELRAALALMAAWAESPEHQIRAAYALERRAPRRMLELYCAVTDGPPWPTWNRITASLRGAPSPMTAYPVSLARLPELRRGWSEIASATDKMLDGMKTIHAASRHPAAPLPFERTQEMTPYDPQRVDAEHKAHERAWRAADRRYHEAKAQANGAELDDEMRREIGDLYMNTLERALRPLGPATTIRVRDPELRDPGGEDELSDTDEVARVIDRMRTLARVRLSLIDWFLSGTQPSVAARGPHALASLGDIAARLYRVFGGPAARRRGDKAKALSRTKSVLSAVWGVEFGLPELRKRIEKRKS